MSDEENKPDAPETTPETPAEKPAASSGVAVADEKETELPESEKAETTIPETAELKIPLWIKLMWVGFVIWLIWYVVMGMQSSPDKWA